MNSGGRLIKPYGDSWGDGQVQLSFTLPLPAGPKAQEAARSLAEKMGLESIQVVHMKDLHGFSYFILYGSCRHSVDPERLAAPEHQEALSVAEINALLAEKLGRKLVVVGAATGTDAHTVGLDAILNRKGFAGEPGLESYPLMAVHNLGSQVQNETLLQKARELKADAVLVSQVVTEKNVHIENLTELIELAEAEGLRGRLIMVVGGPRIDQALAVELGFEAGFGAGTTAREVAAFLARESGRRLSHRIK